MVECDNSKNFSLCLFAATLDWYLSMLLTSLLMKYHALTSEPVWLYKIYWSAYYDAFQQHIFYILFVILGFVFGYIIKWMPKLLATNNKMLLLGSSAAILLAPFTAVGVQGVSLAPTWPSQAPPLYVPDGIILAIPAIFILGFTFYRAIR